MTTGSARHTQEIDTARVSVALFTERGLADGPASTLFEGTSIGIVCFVPGEAPRTLDVVAADEILETFRALLTRSQGPVESPALHVTPTAGSSDRNGQPCDVVLFDDQDQNGRLDSGESYISAWTGGRNSYRLLYVNDPGPDRPGAGRGWNVVEGGFPHTYDPDIGNRRILIDPVIRAVSAR